MNKVEEIVRCNRTASGALRRARTRVQSGTAGRRSKVRVAFTVPDPSRNATHGLVSSPFAFTLHLRVVISLVEQSEAG